MKAIASAIIFATFSMCYTMLPYKENCLLLGAAVFFLVTLYYMWRD